MNVAIIKDYTFHRMPFHSSAYFDNALLWPLSVVAAENGKNSNNKVREQVYYVYGRRSQTICGPILQF